MRVDLGPGRGAKVHNWAHKWNSGTRFVSERAPVLIVARWVSKFIRPPHPSLSAL